MPTKTIKIILLILATLFILAVSSYARMLYSQEGDLRSFLSAAAKITFTNTEMIRLDVPGERYMTKGKITGRDVFVEEMKDRGFSFVEQLGAGYLFENEEKEKLVVTRRHYSTYFSLWNFPEK